MHKPIDTITDMKNTLKKLWRALGIAVGLIAVQVFATISLHEENQQLTATTNSQAKRIDELHQTIEAKDKVITKYRVNAEYIKGLGASHKTTQEIIKASEALNVSPK